MGVLGRMSNDPPHAFLVLKSQIQNDLKHILTLEPGYPVYTVALLICIASEALSKLLGRRRDSSVFEKELLAKHGAPRAVASILFNAVRHGLTHFFDTKTLVIDGQEFVVVISWKKLSHLKVITGDWLHNGMSQPGICLNLHTLSEDLNGFMEHLEGRLRASPKLRREMAQRSRRLQPKIECKKDSAIRVWKNFLKNNKHEM